MDIALSASMRPRPQFRRCRGTLRVTFPDGVRVVRLYGLITAGSALLCNIAPHVKAYTDFLQQGKSRDEYALKRLLRNWLLVLESRGIPFASCRQGAHCAVYVPVLFSQIARAELNEFAVEGRAEACLLPVKPCWWGGGVLALALWLWHVLRFNGFAFYSLPVPPFPIHSLAWAKAFALDTYAVLYHGEWWRTVTALGLHADLRHLLGNMLVGGAFFAALSGRTSLRMSFSLAVWSGFLGNMATLFFRPTSMVSIGFSTACFGLIGAFGAYVFCDMAHIRRLRKGIHILYASRWFTPLAAGLAFLAMLGGAGQPQVDFLAHCLGFGCGLFLGGGVWCLEQWAVGHPIKKSFLTNTLFILSLGLLSFAWFLGLSSAVTV